MNFDAKNGSFQKKKIKEKHIILKQQDMRINKIIEYQNPIRYASDDLNNVKVNPKPQTRDIRKSSFGIHVNKKSGKQTLEEAIIENSILPFIDADLDDAFGLNNEKSVERNILMGHMITDE